MPNKAAHSFVQCISRLTQTKRHMIPALLVDAVNARERSFIGLLEVFLAPKSAEYFWSRGFLVELICLSIKSKLQKEQYPHFPFEESCSLITKMHASLSDRKQSMLHVIIQFPIRIIRWVSPKLSSIFVLFDFKQFLHRRWDFTLMNATHFERLLVLLPIQSVQHSIVPATYIDCTKCI